MIDALREGWWGQVTAGVLAILIGGAIVGAAKGIWRRWAYWIGTLFGLAVHSAAGAAFGYWVLPWIGTSDDSLEPLSGPEQWALVLPCFFAAYIVLRTAFYFVLFHGSNLVDGDPDGDNGTFTEFMAFIDWRQYQEKRANRRRFWRGVLRLEPEDAPDDPYYL